jgi:hypothetical protein
VCGPKVRVDLCATCRAITEAQTQQAVRDLFERVGGFVSNLAQGYRPGGRGHGTTRQTKGLADLYVQFEKRGEALWFEVKKPSNRDGQTPEQVAFQRRNEACGIPSGCGGVPEAKAMLARLGFIILR